MAQGSFKQVNYVQLQERVVTNWPEKSTYSGGFTDQS